MSLLQSSRQRALPNVGRHDPGGQHRRDPHRPAEPEGGESAIDLAGLGDHRQTLEEHKSDELIAFAGRPNNCELPHFDLDGSGR
ncbi:MAG TPA: hypothetical protein VFX03_00875, partial [Thermomicrobiales bacterium]|nr:hypothetical protein [Thermomicrobiales bacterium]